MTLMLMSAALWAEQTVTVSANSSDISEGLDLKVVAKLFAEAKNLEEFETMLNNPDSAFCNLDLNGDGEVDYLRVVETGEGNRRLIVLQAILAKDIYQDVASIYVEKDENEQVTVQVVGDEYVYGTNYIIEPVYVYRPVIYDWFWGTTWVAWNSPWYWGYYPGWWYAHACWEHDWYWHHCYAFHHHHHGCSFHHGKQPHHGYHEMHRPVARRDYASAHPQRSFSQRNGGMTNAHEVRKTQGAQRQTAAVNNRQPATTHAHAAQPTATSRTYGSQHTASARTSGSTQQRTASTQQRTVSTQQRTSSTAATQQRTASTASTQQRTSSTSSTQRTASTQQRTVNTTQRASNAPTQQRTSTASTTQRTTSSSSTSRPISGGSSSSRPSGGGGGGSRGPVRR